MSETPKGQQKHAGDGIRSMRSTTAFRLINFELYAKPVRKRIFILLINYITFRAS